LVISHLWHTIYFGLKLMYLTLFLRSGENHVDWRVAVAAYRQLQSLAKRPGEQKLQEQRGRTIPAIG